LASAVSNLIIIGGILYVGYYLATQTDVLSQLQGLLKGDGGKNPNAPVTPSVSTTPSSAGAGSSVQGNLSAGATGLLFPGTGKTWTAKNSGKTTRNYASGGSSGTTQWDAKGIPANNIESTVDFDWGSCSDTMSIKHYGPDHSDGNCCWLIMNVDGAGKFFLGGEGPHPTTEKSNLATGSSMGSLKGKRVQVKLVTWIDSQVHARGYGFTGGKWVEYIKWDGASFGAKKKASKPASGANTQFRIDCSGINIHSATTAEINPSGGGAKAALAFKRVYYTGQFIYPQNTVYNRRYSQRAYARMPYVT
jgi:hypothetical protein